MNSVVFHNSKSLENAAQSQQTQAENTGHIEGRGLKVSHSSRFLKPSALPFSEQLSYARQLAEVKSPHVEKTLSADTQISSPLRGEWPHVLKDFNASWNEAYQKTQQAVQHLPRESRELIQVQVLVNKVGVQTQLFSQLGEAVGSTLRKIQQFGSN